MNLHRLRPVLRRAWMLAAALDVLVLAGARAQSGDMDLVKVRIRESLSTGLSSLETIQSYQGTLQADGTWADIDYSSTAQTYWPPRTHLDRMKAMAKVYAWGVLQGDATLRDDLFRAYDAWILRDPQSSNWWYQSISTPQYFGEILLLLEGQVSAERLSAGTNLIGRAYVARSVNSGTNTGANRVDRSYATMMRGLLAGDGALTSEAFLSIGDTIVVNSAHQFAEGIQADESFEQHGAQLYVAGYGYGFVQGVLKYASWGADTAFGFSDLQQRVLLDHLLDGVQWFVRGNTIEYTSYGRGLTRQGSTAMALGYGAILTNAMAVCGGYRLGDLEHFRDRIASVAVAGSALSSNALSGNRNFWRSDILVHHRPAFSISVKTSSTRTLQPESGNGEGLKNLHLGDGVTLIQRTGNEYDGIMPVWDWRRLPGTTIEQGTYSLKPASDWGVYGTSTQAGGVSDGADGAAVFNYSRLGVSARKSWFFFGNAMVALGAGITAPSATNPVLTTLNQSLLAGIVTYRTASGTNTLSGTATPAGLQWVHHDRTGYFFPVAVSNATVAGVTQTGTWQSINTSFDATPVNLGVFSLHLNHGPAVSGESYAYIVAPGLAAGGMDAFAVTNYAILRNDGTVQAVRDIAAGKTAASFWAAGSAGGLASDSKAAVLWQEGADFLDLCVSDPTQTNAGSILLELGFPVAGLIRADTGLTVEQMSPKLRVRLAAAKSYGRTFKARFFLRTNAFETISLAPVADAYVHDGSPTNNYGASTNLACKLITSSSSFTREVFLEFDLSTIQRVPVAASLRMSPTTVQTAGIHAARPVASRSWTETGIIWDNRPFPVAPATAFWLPALGERTSSDVLSAVLGRGSNAVDLCVTTFAPTSDGFVYYASRERAEAALRPSLDLVFSRPEIEIWRIDHFGAQATNPAIAGDGMDPDADGLVNAIEFVLGGEPNPANPGWPSQQLLPAFRLESDQMVYVFRRTRASAGSVVEVEHSDDLTLWTKAVDGMDGVSVQVEPDAEGRGIDRVSVRIPRLDGSHHFLRWLVSLLD